MVKAAAAVDMTRCHTRGDVDSALSAAIADPSVRAFVCQNVMARPSDSQAQPGVSWRINLPDLLRSLANFGSFPNGCKPRSDLAVSSLIRGENSDFVGDAQWLATQELFPSMRLLTLPGAKHWVHADRPKELAALLSGELECLD